MTESRIFSLEDQQTFARMTGDWNPIHVDPIYARRTVAGEPVVHGVHLLLWTLNWVARQAGGQVPTHVRASFDRFVLVSQTASLVVTRREETRLTIGIEAEGIVRSSIDLTFEAVPAGEPLVAPDWTLFAPGKDAIDRPVSEIGGLSGHVPLATPIGAAAKLFPHAARWLGPDVIAALGATTRLVGMVNPGLHSIFKALRVTLGSAEAAGDDGVRFSTGAVRHGLVTMTVAGGGISGILTAVVRARPQRQPAMQEVAALLPDDAFAGSEVVVVGASRGLGEVAAKLLAAGGANVIATWSQGAADAERVAAEIREAGGQCTTLRYHVGDAETPFATLRKPPTHGYYFAAPTIARPTSRFFDAARLRDLERFFLDGFWEFASVMRAGCLDARLFYPSTVYVDQWPKGLAEYAMAKAAGEMLCVEINRHLAPLTVVSARLPRLPTDQTAGLYELEVGDPVEVLLPLIWAVQGG